MINLRKIRFHYLVWYRKKWVKDIIELQRGGILFLSAFLMFVLSYSASREHVGIPVVLNVVFVLLGMFIAYKGLNYIFDRLKFKILQSIGLIALCVYSLVTLMDYANPISDAYLFLIALSLSISVYMLGASFKWYLYTKKRVYIMPIIVFSLFPLFCLYFSFLFGEENKDLPKTYINNYSIEEESETELVHFYYGSGEDRLRSWYGKKVDYVTDTIDCERYLEDDDAPFEFFLNLFFKIDKTHIPLNASVYYDPDYDGQYKILIFCHGMHDMFDYSETGYSYLQKGLAKKGFLCVSVDENFLNSGFIGQYDDEEDMRALLLLEHIKLLEKMNDDKDFVLNRRLDFNSITLVGHSRGGEAVYTAAYLNSLDRLNEADSELDYHYDIENVVSIAPTDRRYLPDKKVPRLKDINYFCIHGANDADVDSFYGYSAFNRVEFSDDKDHFAATLYLYGANHGQFNDCWGRVDTSAPFKGLMLNLKPLMPMEYQKDLFKKMMIAFLDAAVYKKDEAREWFYMLQSKYSDEVFGTRYIQCFKQSRDVLIEDFEGYELKEDSEEYYIDMTYSKEEKKRFDNALYINNDENLEWILIDTSLNQNEAFFVDIASLDTENAQEGFFMLEDGNGIRAKTNSVYIEKTIPVEMINWDLYERLYFEDKYEYCFETFKFEAKDFETQKDFDFNNIKKIRYVSNVMFDGIIIDDITKTCNP